MKKCLACGSKLFDKPLLILNNMPASAQDIPTFNELEKDKGVTLNLCQCSGCGLVQFDCEPVAYYKEVIRSGGFTTTMVELRRRQYSHLIKDYHLEGKKILEVGCGRGEFLSVLKEFPVEAFGIEQKSDLVEIARENGLAVVQSFAENEETIIENGPFHAFLSFNFLEHQPDPNGMLRAIYNNLEDNGVGLITVPSFEYIMEHDGFYELIRDHLAYYTFDTLRQLVERNGFSVLEEEMINRDTLAIIVRKKARAELKQLVDSFGIINKEVNDYIDALSLANKKAAIWGASHQGFTLAATTNLSSKVEYIIDSAPFKQGKYAPTSHIPIVAPLYYETHPVDAIIIVAPGYTEEIAGIIKKDFAGTVDILALKSNHLEVLRQGDKK